MMWNTNTLYAQKVLHMFIPLLKKWKLQQIQQPEAETEIVSSEYVAEQKQKQSNFH